MNDLSLKFLNNVEEFCIKNRLFKKGDKILIGFSGGADSTALLLFFSAMKVKYRLSLIAAHVNYHLRGEESIRDEKFVKKFCFDNNISLVMKDAIIKTKKGIENSARKIRLTYFESVAKSYKINAIALGHHVQDQAETILFRMFRGAGYHGLRGISPKSDRIIHPFLTTSKLEIKNFLSSRNVNWKEDSTNQDNSFSRNKIRNQCIPWLEENMNPAIISRLSHLAQVFGEVDDFLKETAKRKINQTEIEKHENLIKIPQSHLLKMRSALRFYIYHIAFEMISGKTKNFYQNHFNEIESILTAHGCKQINLPEKVIVIKEYDNLIFCKASTLKETDVDHFREITSIRKRFSFEDYRITMKKLKKLPVKRNPFEDKDEAYLDFDSIQFPLTIRHRQPGDRFVPLGMEQQKKLKDFFIDEKVSKFERDRVLIFSDMQKIIWIGGMRIHNDVAINENTKYILKIKIHKITHHKARHAERIKKWEEK